MSYGQRISGQGRYYNLYEIVRMVFYTEGIVLNYSKSVSKLWFGAYFSQL